MALSRREILDLSRRLRSTDTPAPADIELLGEHLLQFDGAMRQVADGLRSLGLEPTTRLKTSGTIIEKLKRQRHLTLATIRDLAGARVVRQMTLDEQDAVAAQVMALWPNAKHIDRRAKPSYGYRAVHVVPQLDGCAVEIQLRTLYQDAWAQVMETLGDTWGREVRYGGQPNTPDAMFAFGGTRAEVVAFWIATGDTLHQVAQMENLHAAYLARGQGDSEEATELRRALDDESLVLIRKSIRDLAAGLRSSGTPGEGMVVT